MTCEAASDDRSGLQVGTGDSGRPYFEWMLQSHVIAIGIAIAIGSGWARPWRSDDYTGGMTEASSGGVPHAAHTVVT